MIRRENTVRYTRYIFVLAAVFIVAFVALSYYDVPLIFDLSIAAIFGILLASIIISEKRHEMIAAKKREQNLINSNERLQAEVQEKTAALRNIFERVSDAFVAIDKDWRYTYLNSKAEEFLVPKDKPTGYLLNKHVFSAIPEAKNSEFHRQAEKAMATQNYCYVEGYDPRYDRWLANDIYPSPDGLSIFFHDITVRKKAEEALRMSEERYRLIIETASEAIFIYSALWECIDVNSSACRMTGYTREELRQLNILDTVCPDNLKKKAPQIAELNSGQIISSERVLRKKDGSLFYVDSVSQRMPDGNYVSFVRDVTERKLAEMALRESEERYRVLFEQASDAIIITDKNGIVLDVNTSFVRLFGYSKEEVRGISGSNLIDPDHLIKSPIRLDLLQAGHAVSRERKIRHKNGTLIDIEINSKMLPDGRILGIGRDITERKKVEKELSEAEKKFRDLVEKSLVGVYIVQDGKFVYVNPKAAEIYGYTQEELIGKPVALIADEKEMVKVNENIRLRLDGTRDSLQYEIVARRKDGSNVNVEAYGSRTEFQERPAIIGTLSDITERKKTVEALRLSEQKYKLMFQASPLPMFMYTMPEYDIIDVNEAAVNHYGYSREEFLAMNVRNLRPEEDIPEFLKTAAQEARGSLGTWRHLKKDGTIIHAAIIAHDILYDERPARLALSNDITEQLAAEERLQQSYEEIRMLASHIEKIREEEKIKIAREIHDELGQQLTTMKIDISWLFKKSELKDDVIVQRFKGVLQMLDDTVKTVRRIATELRPGILDDLGLVAAMQWQSQEFEKRSGIKTEFTHDDVEVDIPVSSLSTGLFRIFQESLTNVARHAHATHVSASLTCENNEIILKVADNGQGFDVSTIGQKHTLGLLGMKERTMMMGGSYNITSDCGKGTTVMIRVKCL
jgi:PAS domain S-box-containing protein